MSKKKKNNEKSVKIVNIEGENCQIFWTTWRILMQFSGKLWLIKSQQKEGFTLSLESTSLEKP